VKTVISQFLLAVVVVLVGGMFWIASLWERRAARADEALATLHYSGPASEYSDLEVSMRSARGVPLLDDLVAGIRERRAVAQYWEAADVVPDRDPAVVFVVANAA
jgi:hypothetical protein